MTWEDIYGPPTKEQIRDYAKLLKMPYVARYPGYIALKEGEGTPGLPGDGTTVLPQSSSSLLAM